MRRLVHWFQASFMPLLVVLVAMIGSTVWLDRRAEALSEEPVVIRVERQAIGVRSDDIAERGMGGDDEEVDEDASAEAHPAVLAARKARTRGDTAAAVAGLEAAIRADGPHPQVLGELAVVHLEADRPADALAVLDRAVELAPSDYRARYNRGLALSRLGREEEALAAYEAAIERRRNHFNSHYNRGNVLLRLERYADAARALETAVGLAGGTRKARALSALGLVRARMGERKAARAAYRRAIQFEPGAIGPRYNLVLLLLDGDSGRSRKRAAELLLQIKALRPDFAPAWFQEARLASAAGDDDAALAAYQTAAAKDPGFWKARYNAGVVALRLGRVELAAGLFDRLAEQHPERPEIRFHQGRVASSRSRHEEAAEHYRAAIELAEGDYVEARINLGLCLRALDRHAEALALFDALVAERPDDGGLHRSRGLTLRDLRRIDEARAAFQRSIALRPDDASTHYDLARLEDRAGDEAAAIAGYRAVLERAPKHRGSLINLAGLLADDEQFAEAEAVLRKVTASAPDYSRGWFNLGVVLGRQDRYAEAVDAYRKVIALDPEHPSARQNLGVALGRIDRDDEALTVLREALAREPADLETRYNLAVQLRRMQRRAEAEDELKRCLKLDPTYRRALESLASLLLRDKRSAEVLPLLEPIVQSGRPSAIMRARLGRAYFAQERPAEARAQLELALEKRPRSVEVLSALARVEAASGDFPRAAALVERAVKRRPDSALLKRRLARYRAGAADDPNDEGDE